MAYKRRTNIRINEAIERYLERIKAEGQSDKSIYTARYALLRFAKAVADTRNTMNPYVHEITESDCDEYCFGPKGIRQGQDGKGVAAVTFNRYRSVVYVFFKYAVRLGWCDTNPIAGVDPARPDAPKKRLMLNAGELLTLLDHCVIPLERVGCALGMNTGLRANDIKHLTIFDASLASGVIQTEIRKTRKMDDKPITIELRVELERWLDLYAELTNLPDRGALPDHWLLMPSYSYSPRGRGAGHDGAVIHLRPEQVHGKPWNLVKRPLARMGYPTKGEGFHTLRRSSARAFFESLRDKAYGRDHALMIVKEFLNHASVTQTEHYLGLNHERTIRNALLKDKPFLSALAEREQERVVGTDKLEVVSYGR